MESAAGAAAHTAAHRAVMKVGVVILLAAMIYALVVVEAVQRAKDFVAQIANGIIERLQVLLFLVPLQRQLCAEQFAAHVAAVASVQWQRQEQSTAAAHHIAATRRR